ncbi:MAG: 16S rRNA (cytidine(1402)-2'-O)-methyltransferase [Bacteroidota bacterium]
MSTALYLVPTPIGNLEDITLRALNVLKSVDLILAEDTRTSGVLLRHYDIHQPLYSYHIHNEHQTVERWIARMQEGESLALITDAGTPGISDPGFLLVRAALEANLSLECLPGATAFVPALVKSGLPADKFVFEGFLPHKKGRQTRILQLLEESRTCILYESPHRVVKLLEQLKELGIGDRRVSVSRELTKLYEETITGSVDELIAHFGEGKVKGEIVVVLEGSGRG